MTFKATNKKAIIYDGDRFIGKRRVYIQTGNNDSFIYLGGWIESVYYLTSKKGYTIAIEEE